MCEVRFLRPGETIGDAILRAKRLWFLALIFSGWANLLGWIPSCPHTWGTSSSLTPSKIGLKKDLSLRWPYCAHALRVGDQFDSDDLS